MLKAGDCKALRERHVCMYVCAEMRGSLLRTIEAGKLVIFPSLEHRNMCVRMTMSSW